MSYPRTLQLNIRGQATVFIQKGETEFYRLEGKAELLVPKNLASDHPYRRLLILASELDEQNLINETPGFSLDPQILHQRLKAINRQLDHNARRNDNWLWLTFEAIT